MDDISEEFNEILTDRSSGSTKLLLNFIAYIENHKFSDERIMELAKLFLKKYNHFAVIKNSLSKLNGDLIFTLQNIKTNILTSSQKILKKVQNQLETNKMRILTISNSETLRIVFNAIHPQELYIMRSEPGDEGKILHASIPYESTLIEDKDVDDLITKSKIDAIFCGCDSYSNGTWFVNKVKSRDICILAFKYGIPVFILTSHLKNAKIAEIDDTGLLEMVPWQLNFYVITDQDDAL